ncbi:uncharacterized protein KY384_003391 [Bacidia gigantensis]|uniref:uncharacterized protein n=1 Tax=Bacidia gigantensis TaxID=2732470 RepID=UPI001D041E06|nr:uncharacterized protein KY384_003391 [Bacidia gigantensis]KAG8531759.1 hypothetical protein KY384_003391 [Bacidia gigantensis]
MALHVITILLLAICTSISQALYPTDLIYQYKNGTWLENIAVRSNGDILVTSILSAEVFSINPTTRQSTLVHRFYPDENPLGITESSPDIFQVIIVRNLDLTGGPHCEANSTAIYSFDFNQPNSSGTNTSREIDTLSWNPTSHTSPTTSAQNPPAARPALLHPS